MALPPVSMRRTRRRARARSRSLAGARCNRFFRGSRPDGRRTRSTTMDFEYSQKTKDLLKRVGAFMDEHVYPNEKRFHDEVAEGDRWQPTKLMEELKLKAKAAGLWNLFLPESERGAGLTNLEYAPLCEMMGRVIWSPEVFNCSAPDTGNMEVLERYGTREQKKQWLEPLLEGKIRSCFAMTEPAVASQFILYSATTANSERPI